MIQNHPEIYQLILGLAHCYYNSELINEAIKMYNRAISLNSKCDKAYQGLANIYFYKLNDKSEKAREYALKALECNENNVYAKMIVAFTNE